MKKAILMILAAAMLCGTMTACVSTKTEDSVPEKPEATDAATEAKPTDAESEADSEADSEKETEADTEAPTEADTEADAPAEGDDTPAQSDDAPVQEDTPTEGGEGDAPAAAGDTLGQTLLADFEAKAADGTLSCQILADELMKNPAILFGPATMPVEPGLLNGFGNAEITGFKEGTMFAPMIGSIAFIGYVFELEDGTDGEAFMQTLKDNADMRWNICVEAEETVVGQSGNKVFFVMCPTSLEG